jgi:signal transduction histidine kinase
MMDGKSEWTESTVKQVNRMSELISQLVVLSRLEERQDIVLTDVDMSAEVSSVITSFKSIAETNEIQLDTHIDEDIHVMADQKGLRELVNILLDNAVKYCDEGGKVEVGLTKKGKSAIFTVSNDYAAGEGVDYKRFFDRFYREDKSHNSEKQGYGIGLSMAESLVRMFKGRITVNYKKPVITFTITL